MGLSYRVSKLYQAFPNSRESICLNTPLENRYKDEPTAALLIAFLCSHIRNDSGSSLVIVISAPELQVAAIGKSEVFPPAGNGVVS